MFKQTKMFSYCRLCAEQKKTTELKKTIFDWGIKEKLIACCMWKTSNEEYQIPQTVCNECVDQLENCWRFAQRINDSEQKLLQIVNFPANELEYTKEKTELGHVFIEIKPEDADGEIEDEDVSTSENESDHSRRSARKISTIRKKKKLTKQCSISNILSKGDCLADGTISEAGIDKIGSYLSETNTKTWNDCEFKCNDCDYSARGFSKFHTHDQTTHSQYLMQRSFPCLFCDQVCKRLQSLVVHISYRHLPHLSYW